MFHQRMQALRPHRLVDIPIAQARRVVAPMPEPSVVEHEPLHPDLGRPVGEGLELAYIVVEVNGFPRVQHDRAGRARVVAAGTEVSMEPIPHTVQTRRRVHEIHLRRLVSLARGKPDLPRLQDLTPA